MFSLVAFLISGCALGVFVLWDFITCRVGVGIGMVGRERALSFIVFHY